MKIADPKATILSVIEPFASEKTSQKMENLPPFLTELYYEEYKDLSLADLRNFTIDYSVTDEQIDKVGAIYTVEQANSKIWFKLKAGRITGSNFRSACTTSLKEPSSSLIKIV